MKENLSLGLVTEHTGPLFNKNLSVKELIIAAVIGLFTISLWLTGSTRPTPPLDVTVYLQEYSVELSNRDIPASTPLRITFINQGVVEHQVVLEKAGGNDEPLVLNGTPTTAGVIFPGQKVTATWTIDQPGLYQIACHLPGHYMGGMVQTFQINTIGDLLDGTPTPPVRAIAGVGLFFLLEAMQWGARRAFRFA